MKRSSPETGGKPDGNKKKKANTTKKKANTTKKKARGQKRLYLTIQNTLKG